MTHINISDDEITNIINRAVHNDENSFDFSKRLIQETLNTINEHLSVTSPAQMMANEYYQIENKKYAGTLDNITCCDIKRFIINAFTAGYHQK